ncbi:hypothetical protein QBC46DRAFT_310306 [Diplogelasinospora grovesii]|uniref:Uncharacterized protein n=1 Tax=Diplogelasinospora grovesii TaxID=303347 RepID=A0AAN6NDS4_9PEZI|nr:hypothetical protein QBC46DRAFT_310306 [Diplogelasinospora grovesii]
MSSFSARLKDLEEKIPVVTEYYFVVDCPSLHIIPGSYIDPRRSPIEEGLWGFGRYFCPQCKQVVNRTRQISSACFVDNRGGGPSSSFSTILQQQANYSYSNNSRGALIPAPAPSPAPSPVPALPAPSQRNSPSLSTTPASSPKQPSPVPQHQQLHVPQHQPSSSPPVAAATPRTSPISPTDLRHSSIPSITSFYSNSLDPTHTQTQTQQQWSSQNYSAPGGSGGGLPKVLSFVFSANGQNLLLWKKESQSLVRIELATDGARPIDLAARLPPDHRGDGKSVNIRYVAEGAEVIAVILSHNRTLMLVLLHASGALEHSSLQQLDGQIEPLCLAISRDNRHVAIGLGPCVLMVHFDGFQCRWASTLQVPDFVGLHPSDVKFQACNFSPDSSSLIVATQRADKQRSQVDDAVFTCVFPCEEHPSGPPTRIWPCKMPTDGQGLTTIHWVPPLSTAFITGMIPTGYPMFLSPVNNGAQSQQQQQAAVVPSNITEFRIRCSCMCPPPYSHIIYYMDATNRIFRVDMSSRRIDPVADLDTVRGALKVSEEPAALGATVDGRLRVFWRQGPGLWCLEIRNGEALYNSRRNLRGLWQEAVAD